jgi:Tfp pilus assembly protein PilV
MNWIRKTFKRQCENPDGFTLLEAMIALLVFTVGILGMISLQTTSVNSNTLAEDIQINTITAMAQIEELMATDFLDQRLVGNPIPFPANDPRYTITVTPLDDQSIPGSKQVIVTSEFTPASGRPQRITLKIFKPDIDHVSP